MLLTQPRRLCAPCLLGAGHRLPVRPWDLALALYAHICVRAYVRACECGVCVR